MQNKSVQKKYNEEKNCYYNSSVKFLHNVFGAPNVDIYLNNNKNPVVKNLQYQQFTGYLEFSDKHLSFTVKIAGSDTVLIRKKIAPQNDEYYTAIVTGDVTDLSTISLLIFDDNNKTPKRDRANVRFIHGAFGAPAVDVYVNSAKGFSNVIFGQTGEPEYTSLILEDSTVGSCLYFFKVSVNVANTQIVVVGPLPVNLQNRGVYTIVASGIVPSSLTAVFMQDNIKC